MKRSYEIILAGNQVTNLLTAYFLIKKGFHNIALIHSQPFLPSLRGRMSSSLRDNITRYTHNLGIERTRALMDLNCFGFNFLHSYLCSNSISFHCGEVHRIGSESHEIEESRLAMSLWEQFGFPARSKWDNDLFIQSDGASSIIFKTEDLVQSLNKNLSKLTVLPHHSVDTFTLNPQGISVQLDPTTEIHCELLLLTDHKLVSKMFPFFDSIFVPHADQQSEMVSNVDIAKFLPGDTIYSQHSQLWGTLLDQRNIVVGGASYLRKWAGIGLDYDPVRPEISNLLSKKFSQFLDTPSLTPKDSQNFTDIYSCDEFPIIGPMFGENRVLIAEGFMDSVFTLGAGAGLGLSELVASGKSTLVSSFFYPARLRSMPEN